MAKRKRSSPRRRWFKRRRGTRDRRIPIIATAGIFASLAAANRNQGIERIMAGDVLGGAQNYLNELVVQYTGYDITGKGWNTSRLIEGYAPLILGGLGSMVAGRFANKHMRKIPFIGRYVKL